MGQWQKRSETQEKFWFTFLKLGSKPIVIKYHLTYGTPKHWTNPIKLLSFYTVLFYLHL